MRSAAAGACGWAPGGAAGATWWPLQQLPQKSLVLLMLISRSRLCQPESCR